MPTCFWLLTHLMRLALAFALAVARKASIAAVVITIRRGRRIVHALRSPTGATDTPSMLRADFHSVSQCFSGATSTVWSSTPSEPSNFDTAEVFGASSDSESTRRTSSSAIRLASAILVAEPTSLAPVRGHRSHIAFTCVATGVQAHSSTGKGRNANWDLQIDAKADLYLSEKGSKFSPRMDLNGHAQPTFSGDAMYVAYAGLHKINVKTGKLEWGHAFDVTEKSFKNTNASPLVGCLS